MSPTELKTEIHTLVDRADDQYLLSAIRDALHAKEHSQPGLLWASLTKAQKEEVLLSYEESKDPANLLDADELFNDD